MEDVFDEFSHGLMLREAIGAFISHAYHNWERPPQYVLLLGDATFDYRNILGGGHPSYVPTLYYDARRRGNSPSDYLFSLVDGDDLLPDVAVGRLAVETAVEAEGVVDKIVGYDTEPAPGDWRSRVVYLANHHPKNEFTRPSDELASRFSEPFGLQSVKIYNPDEEHLPNPTGKAFLDALNAGALMVNFNGHGAAGTMQFVFSLQFPDWDYLSQVDNGPPPAAGDGALLPQRDVRQPAHRSDRRGLHRPRRRRLDRLHLGLGAELHLAERPSGPAAVRAVLHRRKARIRPCPQCSQGPGPGGASFLDRFRPDDAAVRRPRPGARPAAAYPTISPGNSPREKSC